MISGQKGVRICGAGSFKCYREAAEKLYGEDIIEGLRDEKAKSFREACDCLPACTAIIYSADIDREKFDWDAFQSVYNAPADKER